MKPLAKKNRTQSKVTTKKTISRKLSITLQCYALIALPIIGFFVFKIYPNLWAISKSFFYYNQRPSQTYFLGFENYINIFTKEKPYWAAWLTTIKFVLLKLPFEVPLALILALMLSKSLKGSGFFRTMYYVPCVISSAITGIIFTNMFGYFGIINKVLDKVGMISTNIDWFAGANSALWVLVIGNLWSNFGINVVYFSAALSNVPDELYEAAEIDGAGVMAKFLKITIPMIAPVFQVILLLAINGTLHVGEYIIVMTNGAPGGATHTVGSYMISSYLPGFATGTPNLGYGCALSLVSSIIYALVAVIYLKTSKKMSEVY